ncbi:MAG: hypothetical protein MUC39_01715 [Candidatus Omnitrophica bacterium]|jgi:hypothetical protein|nr:hypothetical protein [Candidatus Omnitrophota bacterium]
MLILGKACSSIFGNSDAPRMRGNIGTAMLFEDILRIAQNGRVQQPPKIRETFAGPEGAKSTLSEKMRQIH